MKVIAATASAVLLSSIIPGTLSAEPSLRGGAALATDFEDQAADLIDFKTKTNFEDYDLDFKEEEEDDKEAKEEAKRLKAIKKYQKAMKKFDKDLKAYKKAHKEYKRANKQCATLITRSACGAVDSNCVVKENSRKSTFKCITTMSEPRKPKEPKFFEDEEDFFFDSSEDLFDSEDYDLDFKEEEEDDKEAKEEAKRLKAIKKYQKAMKKFDKDLKAYKKAHKEYKRANKQCATLITRSACGAVDSNCVVKENSRKSTFKCITTMSEPRKPKEPKAPKFFEDEEDFYFDSSEDLYDFEEEYDWEM